MLGGDAEAARCVSPARLRTYALHAKLFLSSEFSAFPLRSNSYFSGVRQKLFCAENSQGEHLLSMLGLE